MYITVWGLPLDVLIDEKIGLQICVAATFVHHASTSFLGLAALFHSCFGLLYDARVRLFSEWRIPAAMCGTD